jgi:hypothetical protein
LGGGGGGLGIVDNGPDFREFSNSSESPEDFEDWLRHWDAETLITVTDWFEAVDLRGIAAVALLNVWLWTASLRSGWRVELDVEVEELVVVVVEEEEVACCVCWLKVVFDFDAGI